MEPIMQILGMVMQMLMSEAPPQPPQIMGTMAKIVNMVSAMMMPMVKDMSSTSQVYITTEGDDCSSPPAEDKMMLCIEAMQAACKDVS